MYGSGSGRQTGFSTYNVYEVTAPAPEGKRGWYWELKSTYESAGPYTYEDAVQRGAQRSQQVNKDGA